MIFATKVLGVFFLMTKMSVSEDEFEQYRARLYVFRVLAVNQITL